MNFDQLLFSELRLAAISNGKNTTDDNAITKAMTVNEELINIGYTLSPADIVRLSKSPDLNSFAARIREYAGDVKAKPMYPDFPSQVMAMDDAVFRFHQLVHYMSTYGVEFFTGQRVFKGWLPEVTDTQKSEPDTALVEAKVISLIGKGEKYILPYKKILSKTERMNDKESMIVLGCIAHLTPKELAGVNITFKQNMLYVFNAIFTSEELESKAKLELLFTLCQHTGDVWKCMDYALTRTGYHFRTSQKRLIVKLLEKYPLTDFKANLILSNKKGERTLLMLKYIDFNEYCRSKPFKNAVADFRSGKLRSWESRAKFLAESGHEQTLEYYSQRPGMMLRSLTYLLRRGFRADDIYDTLYPHSAELKTQTLVRLASFFSRPADLWENDEKYNEALVLSIMITYLLAGRLSANKTPLRGKKVYVDAKDFDLSLSEIRVTNKSSEGGYIRSGLAYKIPDNAKAIRFFIYWNDTNRVDVDLHASAFSTDGQQIQVGWNSNYRSGALVFSGDITHSDAAEYVDIDLEKARQTVSTVCTNINLFSGYPTFSEIDECFVGAMAVDKTGTNIKLYDPKNCFFTHYLTGKYKTINYGFIDIKNRVIVFDGFEGNGDYYEMPEHSCGFSVENYLDILFRVQRVIKVDSPEKADVTLVMGKPSGDKEISLIDNNFFMEALDEKTEK